MADKLVEDWVALWRGELTAMAADRELGESWAAMAALWASAADNARGMPRAAHDGGPRPALPATPGAAPAAAASEPGVAALEQLQCRIAELERRLAALERNGGGAAA